MVKTTSVWKSKEVVDAFLESERGAVPGTNLQFEIIGKIIQLWFDNPSRILDLGCGNGILGRYLLDKFPSASGVFIDFSDPMLESARNNLKDVPESTLLKADFSTQHWIESVGPYQPFDIIISGFAIHHQPHERKMELYSEIYNLLSPGGIFLNMEHVISSTPEVEELFEQYYIDHLFNFQIKSDPGISREEVTKSFSERPDKDEDKLSPVEQQCNWLRDIGFNDVDCFFKLFEIAIFGGRKTPTKPLQPND